MSDIAPIDQHAYDAGVDPITWAQQVIWIALDVYREACEAREEDPDAFPGYGETGFTALACRILGQLLDAGWTPPELPP